MTPAAVAAPPIIHLEGIHKSFGQVQANRNIDLSIRTGRIKALLGENGAGKSTLMSILAGRLQPDRGRILQNGLPTPIHNARDALDAGIGMVYQHFMLVDAMTVAENVALGQTREIWLSPARMNARVADLAAQYGLEIDPLAKVSELSMGEKQRVEILKLLHRQSRILIFDEPTAVLTPQEGDQLFEALRLMARQDKAIVFITHKLREVMAVADEIAILQKGTIVAEMEATQVTSRTELARLMVGRDVLLNVAREPLEPRQRVLSIENLCTKGLRQVNLEVRQGEILGLVGVAGNGQKPLVETICGLSSPRQGTIRIMGMPWDRFHARARWDGALIYIPEDRRGMATCLDLDLTENFLLTTRQGFARGPWLNHAHARQKTLELMETFQVQPANARAQARQLSGGNLQKLVLAREFYRRPRLIVAEQPTQGLDIGAMEEVWQVLLKARQRAGILLVTGDLSEALALSDRIAVMFDGRIMDTITNGNTDKLEHIGLLMAGIAAETING